MSAPRQLALSALDVLNIEPQSFSTTAGSHHDTGSKSLAGVLGAFVPSIITAILFLAAFVAIRSKYRIIYSPRTYLGTIPEKQRTPSSSLDRFGWFKDYRRLTDKFVLQHQNLDAYLYLRFLRTIVFISVVGTCLTWPILFPVNATAGGGEEQLNRISISNVPEGSPSVWAHAVVAVVFLSFIMLVVARERIFLVGLRQAHLLSKPNAARLSSRTVLFLAAPKEALKSENLRRFFGEKAKKIWPVSRLDKLDQLVQDRNSAAMSLETAEVQMASAGQKRKVKGNTRANGAGPTFESLPDPVKKSLRPTHIDKDPRNAGKKIDTIDWARENTTKKAEEVEKERNRYESNEIQHGVAVFVEFQTQAAAQSAFQQIPYRQPLAMEPRYIGMVPKEIIWKNLTPPPARRISQMYFANALVAATIIFWTIPIGIVGAIASVDYLKGIEGLQWIDKLPDSILGLLQGLLPPLAISSLVSYVPKIFRYWAKMFGEPTNSSAELRTQTWYFAFQVIQVFLITTFSSGAASVAQEVYNDPSKAPELLAKNLPTAANFYLTYFILQGTASAAKTVLNYSDLFEYMIYDILFDKTPRAKYNRYTNMKGMSWGSVFPKFTNFVVIAIVYSCIAPLVIGFGAIGLYLYYLAYRYQLLYAVQAKIDTKGLCYTKALQQMLTGVYLAELCLIGLFGLKKVPGPAILMTVLLILTIIYHITMNRYVTPLEIYLPMDLQTEDEDEPLLSAEEGRASEDEPASAVERLGHGRVPDQVLRPVAEFLEPHIYASHRAMQAWLHDPTAEDDAPEYSENDIRTAYLNPALTSKTPKLWLARDDLGISKKEIEENESVGISSTDQGAWLDEKNHLRWSMDDFSKVPIFKQAVKY